MAFYHLSDTLADAPAPAVPAHLPALELFGLPVVSSDRDTTLAWITRRLEQRKRTTLAFVNAHCVNVVHADPAYRASLLNADALLPDGSGVALASRLIHAQVTPNLNGTDLVPLICERIRRSHHAIFLLGARPGVALRAAATLRQRYPGLRIAGVHDGYFTAETEGDVIDAINRSGADILIVAMGVPRQELWVDRVRSRLDPTLVMGVGGCLDFHSGRIPRAPGLLRRLGLEWTYRLYQEPGRMWRRYVLGNPAFVLRALAVVAGNSGRKAAVAMDDTAKRVIDIAGALFGLTVLSPFILATLAAIRLESPGSAIFTQIRVGRDGRLFRMYKFRSMFRDAEKRRKEIEALNDHGQDGVTFKMKADPRVTKVGRLLRRSSMDELPQLINVLKGDMSLVGPRPPLPNEVLRYSPEERKRLAGKPGLTGLWQVSGRADLAFDKQVALDLEYLRRRSVLLDLAILVRTVGAVITARGAY